MVDIDFTSILPCFEWDVDSVAGASSATQTLALSAQIRPYVTVHKRRHNVSGRHRVLVDPFSCMRIYECVHAKTAASDAGGGFSLVPSNNHVRAQSC